MLTNVFKQANFAGTSFEGIGLSSSVSFVARDLPYMVMSAAQKGRRSTEEYKLLAANLRLQTNCSPFIVVKRNKNKVKAGK
jgi:hypothetical protein